MTHRAKLYIGSTIIAGCALVATCLMDPSNFANSLAFLAYCSLAAIASTFKVKLPGITGTISVNFLFVLVATAVFSFQETVLTAAVAGVIQCLWKSKRKPQAVQVAFNVAALALSGGATYRLSHFLAGSGEAHILLLMVAAGCLYFISNTLLVSGVLSLVQAKPLMETWKQCYLWSFPYYLVGAGIAGLVVATGRAEGWQTSVMVLPLMYLVYQFYRMCVERMTAAMPSLGHV